MFFDVTYILNWIEYKISFKGTPPPFPAFLENGLSENVETCRADRSWWVEQKLSRTQTSRMLSSIRYWGHNWSKWPHFSHPPLRDTMSDRAENFFTDTGNSLGWVYFFFPLYLLSFEKKSQNTGHTLKSACFFTRANFVTAAKNPQSNIFWNKKKYPRRIVSSICEKNFSSIPLTMPEIWVWNSTFFLENLISRKTQNKIDFRFFSKYSFFFLFRWSFYRFSTTAHPMTLFLQSECAFF